ncbi:MAG: AtpZ/AtpI family protein [Schleiferiaceae bacterium]|nr:AtpZ/AtpI family protein [Schleiferiaceae bacterium]
MKNAIKFSGMAFQMAATIGLGTYGGYRWDLEAGRWSDETTPWATVACALLSTLLALGVVIKQILDDSK